MEIEKRVEVIVAHHYGKEKYSEVFHPSAPELKKEILQQFKEVKEDNIDKVESLYLEMENIHQEWRDKIELQRWYIEPDYPSVEKTLVGKHNQALDDLLK